MSLIRGLGSQYPCPICLVSEDDLSDMLKPITLRTTEAMQRAYMEAQKLPQSQRDDALKTLGLRDVEVLLVKLYRINLHVLIVLFE